MSVMSSTAVKSSRYTYEASLNYQMGLDSGEYGVKAFLRGEFEQPVRATDGDADEAASPVAIATLGRNWCEIFDWLQLPRAETAIVADFNVLMFSLAGSDALSAEAYLQRQEAFLRAAEYFAGTVVLCNDTQSCAPTAKQREKARRDASKRTQSALHGRNVQTDQPMTDEYTLAALNRADARKLVSCRQARDRFFDHVCRQLFEKRSAQAQDQSGLAIDCFDAMGAERPIGQARCSVAHSTNLALLPPPIYEEQHQWKRGEGDIKMAVWDAHLRDCKRDQLGAIVHVTKDQDALPILLLAGADRACQCNCYEAGLLDNAPTTWLVMNERVKAEVPDATGRLSREWVVRHCVIDADELCHQLCVFFGVDGDATRAMCAMAALACLWALGGCDYVAFTSGRANELSYALQWYLINEKVDAHVFESLLRADTAKQNFAALQEHLMTIWRRAAQSRRRRPVPPTERHIRQAIWTCLYWQLRPPPEIKAHEWGFEKDDSVPNALFQLAAAKRKRSP